MLPSNNVTQRRTISLIAISHVIPDEQPVRFRSQVGVLTTAYRRGPEVRFGEVTWTYSRLCAEVPAGANSRDTGFGDMCGTAQSLRHNRVRAAQSWRLPYSQESRAIQYRWLRAPEG